jgi:serine kinase of HPr protein (carbohydrate metabolism regulator)
MRVTELAQKLGYEIVNTSFADNDITTGYTSDLLSDVMANAEEGCVLITIQAHKNTIAVATMVGASAILICNSRQIPQDMIDAANQESLPLLRTNQNQYEASYRVYGVLGA